MVHLGPGGRLRPDRQGPDRPRGDAGLTWAQRIPYGDCDQQGVVFNAKYLAYVDDVVDRWWSDVLGTDYLGAFDFMLKKATVEWASPAKYRDVLECTPSVDRWGRTSFDVRVDGRVGERPVFTATIVYVSVTPGTHEPTPVTDDIKARLSSSTSSTSSA